MNDQPEDRQFSNSDELLAYIRGHVDDIDQVIIPVQEGIQTRDANGKVCRVVHGAGALIKLCSGETFIIRREDAAILINDGVLQRMNIKCVLDPLK